jgi:hypothetical protein
LGAARWIPVKQSGWIDYDDTIEQVTYPWVLSPIYGMRVVQCWAVDNAGNISRYPSTDVINLLPSEQGGYVAEDGVVFYRILLNAGDSFSATLMPIDGDPDLYVWGASDGAWFSTNPTGVDSVQFEAPETGTYQIEVHGYTDAHYQLTFGTGEASAASSQRLQTGPKPTPSAPAVPMDEWPMYYDLNPPVIPPAQYTIYLPMTSR